jgi:hypothetical protein
MRSGLIFSASTKITNRYMLCRMLAASARRMHRDGVSTSQCINSSLRALQDGPAAEKIAPSVATKPGLEEKEAETPALALPDN